MSEPAPAYRKLPGGAFGMGGRTRLWLAQDHVLEANSTMLTERYHRFFLRDIRALLVLRTKAGRVISILLAIAGLGCSGAAALMILGGLRIEETEARVGMWVLAGMFGPVGLVLLTLLIINLFLGPTCRCVIHTGAGAHTLQAPGRLRGAQRLLVELPPHIEAAQAAVAAEPSFAPTR
ncbi:MAG: hypothetical protein QOE70_475 [Chthoniobacter sp.]|jgi:hypothetical protein|nr:hypothetical protein [Chthoniobacter sp.]